MLCPAGLVLVLLAVFLAFFWAAFLHTSVERGEGEFSASFIKI
jgi:hypothetical protein